jgi:acyl-CoA hydrolase
MSKKTVETTENQETTKVQLKTVGFVALDENGNPITNKVYSKRSTAKGLETKAEKKKKEAEAKAKAEKLQKRLQKRLENAVNRLNNRLG